MKFNSLFSSKFYLYFLIILTISFLLDSLSFNENFLIGGLFTIGFFTVLTLCRANFTNTLITELIKIHNQFLLRQKLILIYKLTIIKIVFFSFVLFFKIRFSLILFKLKYLFLTILLKLKNINIIWILMNLIFFNLLSNYYYAENFILTQVWCVSIKFSYTNLI